MSLSKTVGRAIVAAMVGFVLATGVSLTPALAQEAPNSAPARRSSVDSGYGFNLGSKGATDGTNWRQKETASSTYIKVEHTWGASPQLFVDGAWDSRGSGKQNMTIGRVRAPGVGRYEIHNNVYEHGYRWARITCWADLGAGGLSGLWSPDCAGNYADLN